jgi:YgiT-type zinc finger domain-containing protein
MRCPICKHGETAPGSTTVTLERGEVTVVVKAVPAGVCANCGEEYLEETVTQVLFAQVEAAVEAGVTVEVREYRAA